MYTKYQAVAGPAQAQGRALAGRWPARPCAWAGPGRPPPGILYIFCFYLYIFVYMLIYFYMLLYLFKVFLYVLLYFCIFVVIFCIHFDHCVGGANQGQMLLHVLYIIWIAFSVFLTSLINRFKWNVLDWIRLYLMNYFVQLWCGLCSFSKLCWLEQLQFCNCVTMFCVFWQYLILIDHIRFILVYKSCNSICPWFALPSVEPLGLKQNIKYRFIFFYMVLYNAICVTLCCTL